MFTPDGRRIALAIFRHRGVSSYGGSLDVTCEAFEAPALDLLDTTRIKRAAELQSQHITPVADLSADDLTKQ